MSKWILCKDKLPPINTDVLIFTGESQHPYEIMQYCGKKHKNVTTFCNGVCTHKIEEYNCWRNHDGGVRSNNPVAWQLINNFMKEGEIWVEGRVV